MEEMMGGCIWGGGGGGVMGSVLLNDYLTNLDQFKRISRNDVLEKISGRNDGWICIYIFWGVGGGGGGVEMHGGVTRRQMCYPPVFKHLRNGP